MKSYLKLAWKELKAQRVTAVLIFIAVVMSSVMTTVVGRSIGILQAMRIEQAEGLNGSRYATFHQLSKEQARQLHEDARLYDVGDWLYVGNLELPDSGLTLALREYHDDALERYKNIGQVMEGRLPERENEIALPEDALKYLGGGIAIGDTVSLDLSVGVMDGSIPQYAYSAEFVLTAILESDFFGYASGSVSAIVGVGTAEALLPAEYLFYSTDFKTRSKADFQEIIRDLADRLRIPENVIQYNWVFLDALGISYGEAEGTVDNAGFSFMAFACVSVGALVLLAAGLVIYNVLRTSVVRRIQAYGTLRAIGGERGQLYRIVALQLLILCGGGIPIGLLLGIWSARGILLAATNGMGINPKLFMANSEAELAAAISSAGTGNIGFLFLSVAVTLTFALLAAFPAARYAARVSPTVAMSGQAAKIRRRGRKTGKIRCFEAYYARLNMKRGRGRTVITVLSLVMSITVFVALQSFTGILDTSSKVRDMYQGDYAVTNETVGMDEDAVLALREQEAVEHLATAKVTVFASGDTLPFDTDLTVLSHETLQIASMDEARFLSAVSGLSEQDRQDLSAGRACLIKNPIPFSYGGEEVSRTELAVGDVIAVGGYSLRIAGLVNVPVIINNSGYINGVQIIVTDDIYNELVNSTRYSEVYPTLQQGADAVAFEAWLDQWCGDMPGTHWLSYRQADAQMEESFAQLKQLCWLLIFFVGVIGILNIINTVYSNIHTRVAEIGMQRAIGMSAAGLYKTFLWEGAYYGIIASVIGAVSGYICCVLIGAATTDALRLVPIPFASIAAASCLSVAACLSATAVPLRAIARMNIVESIEAVE